MTHEVHKENRIDKEGIYPLELKEKTYANNQ